jgi:cytochrome c biogenesis protein CcmG/thiol:disulfide interchange protein DsbE
MAPRGTLHGLWALFVTTTVVAAGVIVLSVVLEGAAPSPGFWPGTRTGHAAAATRRTSAGMVPFPGRGSVARDFTLPVLAAESPWIGADTMRLSDLRGRWVYLDVFGSWCLPCTVKYPKMIEIARTLEHDGVAVVGLLLDERPQAAAAWFAANGGMAYPFLLLDDRTATEWGLTGAPMGFLISPEGRIERKCYGCSTGADAVDGLPRTVRELSRP